MVDRSINDSDRVCSEDEDVSRGKIRNVMTMCAIGSNREMVEAYMLASRAETGHRGVPISCSLMILYPLLDKDVTNCFPCVII